MNDDKKFLLMAFYLSVSNLAQLVTQVGKGYSQGQRALEHSVFVIAKFTEKSS